MTAPGPGEDTPPPTWSSYLLTLPREVRDVVLYRYLNTAVTDRKKYGDLLLTVAKSLAGAKNGTRVSGELTAKALATGADSKEWTQYLLQLPLDQRNLILYDYLAAVAQNRTQYALLLNKIASKVLGSDNALAAELIDAILAAYEPAS